MKTLSRALTNMRRTPYQSMSAILVLTSTFFLSILVAFTAVGMYQVLKYFESSPQVLVFFKVDTPESQILEYKNSLIANESVSHVEYIAKEQALEEYRSLNQQDPLLLELVTAEILPASLEVSTNSIDALSAIAALAKDFEGVDEVAFRQDVVDELEKWLRGVELAGVGLLSVLGSTALLTVMVIVGMKISSRNNEVKILRLIGASRWYISGPYLLEGALYGIVAAVIAYGLALSLILYATPFLIEFGGGIPLLPTSLPVLLSVLGGSLAFGAIIGIVGGLFAIKRYIKL